MKASYSLTTRLASKFVLLVIFKIIQLILVIFAHLCVNHVTSIPPIANHAYNLLCRPFCLTFNVSKLAQMDTTIIFQTLPAKPVTPAALSAPKTQPTANHASTRATSSLSSLLTTPLVCRTVQMGSSKTPPTTFASPATPSACSAIPTTPSARNALQI